MHNSETTKQHLIELSLKLDLHFVEYPRPVNSYILKLTLFFFAKFGFCGLHEKILGESDLLV